MRRRRHDDAQLMMLAGIVLTISFILTSLTLSQVASLEKEAAQDGPSPILQEWRFLHDRLASNVRTAVTPETTLDTFKNTLVPTLAATFRALAAEKGYDIVLRLADGGNFEATGNEAMLDLPQPAGDGDYDAWSYDGAVHYDYAEDGTLDGIIWDSTCPDTSGPIAGCIGGVYLFLRLADGTSSVEESILFATNQA